MAHRDFLLPDLGEGLEDAEIVAWRVAEGDRVELNQPLVEVNTAKALVEIPSPFAGVLVKLHGVEGDVIHVGQPLVTIDVEGEVPEATAPAPAAGPGEERTRRRPVLVGYGVEEEETEALPRATLARTGERRAPVAASPPVRRLARELGVDLATVTGTGPRGRVTREDVLKAAQAGEPVAARAGEPVAAQAGGPAAGAAEEAERIPVRGTRRLVAEKMARSVREIPHVSSFVTVDASHLESFRHWLRTPDGRRVSPLAIIVRALVEVGREHPKLNASFDAERREIVLYRRYHVGIATDTEGGLLVPVVRDADRKGILEIAAEIGRLAEAARSGSIRPEELVGSTVTVTNYGTFGSELGTPIINYPEAVILGIGVIAPRALVVDGEVRARPAVTLSLTFDHRLLDGAEAGRALRALADLLESPDRLASLPR